MTQRQQKTSQEGYLGKIRVEPGRIQGAPSGTCVETDARNKPKEKPGDLLEQILERNNLNRAYQRVKANRGSHGVDGMKVDELLPYLQQNGQALREAVLEGSYVPQPVRRVEIPKPDGGKRQLGIPTVIDRVLQQAITQILTPIFDRKFSGNSYGFRPKRSAHQAVEAARKYIQEGYRWVVDIDLAKYFDTVNHDKLMGLVEKNIEDKRVTRLIRKYLKSGVMSQGVVIETHEGCPQGGPLSPLLSNIMLDELDKELERRGHRFCRYADDCNIYVKSKRAGERVMKSITDYLEEQLRLKVNQEKSAVDRPWKRKFLGFSFYLNRREVRIRVAPKTIRRFKDSVREILSRSDGRSIAQKLAFLNEKVQGWANYFKIADMKQITKTLDEWMRRRLRMCIWKQWRKVKTRYKSLIALGLKRDQARMTANTRKGCWHISNIPNLHLTLTNAYLAKQGFVSLFETYSRICIS